MNRNEFKQLLKKYIAGDATEEETNLIEYWYNILYHNTSINQLNETIQQKIAEDIWMNIENETNIFENNATPNTKPINRIIKWSAAAAIVIGIIIGYYGFYTTTPQSISYQQNKQIKGLQEYINTTETEKKIALEDGSIIELKPRAKLAFPKHFASENREVYLEGEAFFNVTKNPNKPFLVYSGNIITKVLGTSFIIKPNAINQQIVVSVKTGKVAVFENNKQINLSEAQQKNNGIIITPNQQTIYNTSYRNFITTIVENPEPVGVSNEINNINFLYEDEKLLHVIEQISKVYAIEIVVENENINQCKFTGNISKNNLFEKLEVICLSTNHQYELKGTKILIKGKGCK